MEFCPSKIRDTFADHHTTTWKGGLYNQAQANSEDNAENFFFYSSFPVCNPANWRSSVFVAPRDATAAASIDDVAAKFGAAGTVVGINAVTPTKTYG